MGSGIAFSDLRKGSVECVALVLKCTLRLFGRNLCTEVMELAGNASHDNKKLCIVSHHILLAGNNDVELNKLLAGVMIMGVERCQHPGNP